MNFLSLNTTEQFWLARSDAALKQQNPFTSDSAMMDSHAVKPGVMELMQTGGSYKTELMPAIDHNEGLFA